MLPKHAIESRNALEVRRRGRGGGSKPFWTVGQLELPLVWGTCSMKALTHPRALGFSREVIKVSRFETDKNTFCSCNINKWNLLP